MGATSRVAAARLLLCVVCVAWAAGVHAATVDGLCEADETTADVLECDGVCDAGDDAASIDCACLYPFGDARAVHVAVEDTLEGRSVVAADLDGDGDADLAMTAMNGDRVFWFENTDGAGTYGPEQLVDIVNGPVYIRAADIDADNDMDLFVSVYHTDELVWYKNDGSATFERVVIDDALDVGRGLALEDVNGDGHLDIVSAGYNADTIVWYEHDGTPTPSFTKHVVGTSDGPISVAAGDMDGDGDVDIVAAFYRANRVRWFENNDGAGTSWTMHTIASVTDTGGVTLGDVNEDGHMDVVATGKAQGRVIVFTSDGAADPSFSSSDIDTDFEGAWGVLCTDVDGDGDPDILATARTDGVVALWENTGFGKLTKRVLISGVADPFEVAMGDVNGDGQRDVLYTSAIGRETGYLLALSAAACDGVCDGEDGADSVDCDGTCDSTDAIAGADCSAVCNGNGMCDSGEAGDGACIADCDGVCIVDTDALDSVDCNVPVVLLVDEASGSIVDNDLITALETAVAACSGQLAVDGKAADSFDNTQTLVEITGADATCLTALLTEAAEASTSALVLLGTYDVLSLQFADKAYSLGGLGGDIVGGTSDVGTAYRSVQVEMPASSLLPATDMSVSMPVNPGTTSKDVRVRLYGTASAAPVNPRSRGRGRPSAVAYQETTFTVDANLAGTSSSVEELDSPFLVCVDVGGLGTPSLLYYSESNNAWFNAAQTCIDYPIPEAVGVVESVDEAPVYEFGAPYTRVESDRMCTWICHLTQYAVFDAAATTTGDPHFEGFRGGWYDFMGEAGKVFNLFTDTTLHVNARFVDFPELPGQTYMGEIGVRAGPHRVYMAADGTVRVPDAPGCVLVDPSEPNKCALSGGGHVRWSDERVDIEWDVYRISLTTEVWTFEGTDAEAHGLGYSMAVNHAALARSGRADTWAPHGVHGQVADVQHVVVGSGKQGEGVVAGHFRDYEVASGDLFGVDVMHAQWSESAAAVVSEESEESEWEVEGVSARAQ